MKKAFNECFKAVVNCEEDGTGRKRSSFSEKILTGEYVLYSSFKISFY